jgi:hypothetical protein
VNRTRPFWQSGTITRLLVAGGVLALAAAGVFWFRVFAFGRVTALEENLVYKTDHKSILEACKWIQANPELAGLQGGHLDGRPWDHSNAKFSKDFPAILQTLDFEFINVRSESVEVTFGGGLYHYGFTATEGNPPGQTELIPGLWYWNEWGKMPPNPEDMSLIVKARLAAGTAILLIVCAILQRKVVRNATCQLARERSGGGVS